MTPDNRSDNSLLYPEEGKTMLTIRKPGKADLVVNMFTEIGEQHSVTEVCEVSGIKNYNSLKAMLSYIRKAPVNNIDVRIKEEQCIRVN